MNINMLTYSGPCIYTIWSSETPEKIYVGKTINYTIRSKRHFNDLKAKRHGNIYLQRIFNKGQELNICPLEFCNKDSLLAKEVFWVDFFKTNTSGYNFSKGGESIPDKLIKWSDERKKAWSKRCSENPIAKGVKKSDSWKRKMQESIQKRREAGNLMNHLNNSCIVTDTINGLSNTYKSIKEAASITKLSYTYIIKKLKTGNGTAIIKHYKIEKNG